MPLTDRQKQTEKARFNRMIEDIEHFAEGDVKTLYVIDKSPLLKASDALGDLIKKLPRATWTRGKQGHGHG